MNFRYLPAATAVSATKVIPAVQAAADEDIPVVSNDRRIEDDSAFDPIVDTVEVGRTRPGAEA